MKAFVFSGGGVRVAHQCAVFRDNFASAKQEPSLFAGISAGSLLASVLAQAATSKEGVYRFEEVLKTIHTKRDIYRPHGYGFFPLWFVLSIARKSFYHTSPLREKLKEVLEGDTLKNSKNPLVVGVYHYNTRKYVEVDKTSRFLFDAVIASASLPVLFQPVTIQVNGEPNDYGDGGIINNIPHEKVLQHNPSEIYLFFSNTLSQEPSWKKVSTLFDLIKQVFFGVVEEYSLEDLTPYVYYALGNPKVPVHVITPKKPLAVPMIDFRKETIQSLLQSGSDFQVTDLRKTTLFLEVESLIQLHKWAWPEVTQA